MTSEPTTNPSASNPPPRYMHGYGSNVNAYAERTAQDTAGFFLSHLRPGMKLLDCGSGPGSITVGLAEAVAPGEVVGIDIAESQVIAAQARANEIGLDNVRFQVADVLDLPFPDESFDAVSIHYVLEHLEHPEQALSEGRRVLRRGGFIGLMHGDRASWLRWPHNQLVEDAFAIYEKHWAEVGSGNPYFARRQHHMLSECGFTGVVSQADGRIPSRQQMKAGGGIAMEERLQRDNIVEWAERGRLADREALAAMGRACREWVESDDVFAAFLGIASVGYKD